MRTAFIQTLYDLAGKDSRIILMTGDLGFTVFEPYIEKYPGQFINAGVAEQNMTGTAAGMALAGKVVFTYSIGNFSTLRCVEQIRNDVCYHKANVKIVSVGAGLTYGPLGSSHHALEDIAIMRALPNMVVAAPGDPLEAQEATKAAVAHDGPFYLRLGKAGEPKVHKGPIRMEIGKAIEVRFGDDLTIISTGTMLKPCEEAAILLAADHVSARLLSMPYVKPIDRDAIVRAAAETRGIVTVEEHGAFGGLGGAVAEVLVQSSSRVPMRMVNTGHDFCQTVGSQNHLRKLFGLTPENIAANAKGLLRQ